MTVCLKRKIMSALFWTRLISLIQFSMSLPLQPLMTRRVDNFEAEKPFIFNWLKFQSISYLNMTTEIRELYNMSLNRSITYHNEANGKTVLKPTSVPFSTKQPLSVWSDSIPELNLPDSQIYMSASEKFENRVPHNDHSDKEKKYIIEENSKKGTMEYLKWPNPPNEMNFSAENLNSNNTNSTQSEHFLQKEIVKVTEANPVFIKTSTILPWMIVYENNGQINSKNLVSEQPKTSSGGLVKIISSTLQPEEINVEKNIDEIKEYDKVQSPSEIKETRVRMDDSYLVSQQVDENLKNYNGNILSPNQIAQKDEKTNDQKNKPKLALDVFNDDDLIASSTSSLKSSIETDWGNEKIINESENKEEAILGNKLMSSTEEESFDLKALRENNQTKELIGTIHESIQEKGSDQDTSNDDKYNQAASENKEIKIKVEQTTQKLSEATSHFTDSDQLSTIINLVHDNSITSTEHATTFTNDNDEVQIDTNSSDSFSKKTVFSDNNLAQIGNSNDEYLDLNKNNWEFKDNDKSMGASENQEVKTKVEETTKTGITFADNLDGVTRPFGRKELNSEIESNEMNSSEKKETFSPQLFTTEIVNNWSNKKIDASENEETTVKLNEMIIHVNPDHLSSIAIRNFKKDDPLTSTEPMTIERRFKIDNGKATTVEIDTEKVLDSSLEKESLKEITTNETAKTTELKTYVTDNHGNSKKENFDLSNTMKTYDKKHSDDTLTTEIKITENIWESTTESEKNNLEVDEVMSASENKMITITADEITNTHTQKKVESKEIKSLQDSDLTTSKVNTQDWNNYNEKSEATIKSNIDTAHNAITNDEENDDVLTSSLQEDTIQFYNLDEMDQSMGASEIEGIKIKSEEAVYFTNPDHRSVTISNLVHDNSMTSTEHTTFKSGENKATTVNTDEKESHEKHKSREGLDYILPIFSEAENDDSLNNSYEKDESDLKDIRAQVESSTHKLNETTSHFNDSDQSSSTTINDNSITSTEHTTFKNNNGKGTTRVDIDEKESHEKIKSHEDLDYPFLFSAVAENDENLNNSHERDESMGASEIKEVKVPVEQTTPKLSEKISHFTDYPDQRTSIAVRDLKKDHSITTEDGTTFKNDESKATTRVNIDEKEFHEKVNSHEDLDSPFSFFPFSKLDQNDVNLDTIHETDESMGASEIKEIKVQVEQTTQKLSETISHFTDHPDQSTSIAVRDFKKDHSITTEDATTFKNYDDEATTRANIVGKGSHEKVKSHEDLDSPFSFFPFSKSDQNDENLNKIYEMDKSMGALEIKEIKVQVEQTTQKLSEAISHFTDHPDQRTSVAVRDFIKDHSITTKDATTFKNDDDEATTRANVVKKESHEKIKSHEDLDYPFLFSAVAENDENSNSHERDKSMRASEIKEIKVPVEQTTPKLSETISHVTDHPDQSSSIAVRDFKKDHSITTEDATTFKDDENKATTRVNIDEKESHEKVNSHEDLDSPFSFFPFSKLDKNDENLDNSHENKEIKVNMVEKESHEKVKSHEDLDSPFSFFPFSKLDRNDENLDKIHETDESMGASERKEIKVQVEQTTQKLSETKSHFTDHPDQGSSIAVRDFEKDHSITTEDVHTFKNDENKGTTRVNIDEKESHEKVNSHEDLDSPFSFFPFSKLDKNDENLDNSHENKEIKVNIVEKGSHEKVNSHEDLGSPFSFFPFSELDRNDENLDKIHETDESMGASEIKEIKVQVEQTTQKLSETISHFTDHPDQRSSIAIRDFIKDYSITTEDATSFKSDGDKATTLKLDTEASHQIFESREDYDGHIPISTEEENNENMNNSRERLPMQFEKTTQKLKETMTYFTDHPEQSSSITIREFKFDDSITDSTPVKEINFNHGTTTKIHVKESLENIDRDETSIHDDSSNTVNNDDLINLDDNYDMGASEILETKIEPETIIKEGELIKNVSEHTSTHEIENEQLSGEHSNKSTDHKKSDDSDSIKDIDLWKVIINYDDIKGPIFKQVIPQRKNHDENESYELKSVHKTLELEFLNQSLNSENDENVSTSNSSGILNIAKDYNLENEYDKNIPVTFTTNFKNEPLAKASKELSASPYEDRDQESSEEENFTQFDIVSSTPKISHEKIVTKPAVSEPITHKYQFNINQQNKFEKVNEKEEFTTNGYERSFTFFVPRQKTFDFSLSKIKQEFNH